MEGSHPLQGPIDHLCPPLHNRVQKHQEGTMQAILAFGIDPRLFVGLVPHGFLCRVGQLPGRLGHGIAHLLSGL
eukprot:3838873-Lingulodinium_polyedra.AAC.1